jgi:phosphoglycerate dehydrogenase-like enzyme
VGTRLAYMAQLLGWNVIGYDPLVQRENVQQVEFEALLKKPMRFHACAFNPNRATSNLSFNQC